MNGSKVIRVSGRVIAVTGSDIDTDRIMPARFLKAVTYEGLEKHIFEDDRHEATARGQVHPFDDDARRGARILLVGSNFGCGSSREHAPQALVRWGIRAVIGESFAEIFFGNAVMIGLPCVTAAPADVLALMARIEAAPATSLVVDLAAGRLDAPGFSCVVSMPPHARDAFVTGAWDTTGLLLERVEDVDATAARLPYVNGFASPPPR